MRQGVILAACAAFALSACQRPGADGVSRAVEGVNVIDESNLNDIMLTVADPDEAVAYFQRATAEDPTRIDLKRGLARSLVRAGQAQRALPVWREVVESPDGTHEDRVDYASALVRAGDWETAELQLNQIPPTFETFERYRLEAMVADSNRDWERADAFYETAVGLTLRPAGVLNNWGYSKLTRGDFREAEQLFSQAIEYDNNLFTAKNNLVLARGAQRNYRLPTVPTTQTERAQLLHTMALSAIKQGDVATGRALLQQAIDTHPQHFDAAVRALRTLETTGG